jgi:hypothetical protein
VSIKPLPNLDNPEVLAKLGRAHTLRSARLDAIFQLRDAYTMLNNDHPEWGRAIKDARQALDRLEQLSAIALHED